MSDDLDPVERLIEQFQAGVDPEESFRGIFQLYHPRVEAFFRRKGFSEEESRDLTQETFFRVYRALPTFRRDSSMLLWLFGIMEHVYKNELRRRKAEKRDGQEVPLGEPAYEGGPPRELAADRDDPVSRLIRREQSQALDAALQELPEQMRSCCILRYKEGYKYDEISRLMGISIETVKAHLFQARKRLTAKLGDTEHS